MAVLIPSAEMPMRRIPALARLLVLLLALAGLACKEVATAPSSLSYSVNPASYVVGMAIAANTPTHGGGSPDSYSVSPALPAGLSLDAKTGAITGTPTAAAATATYTVTATNSAGNTSVALSITVVDALSITTHPADQTVLSGQTATFAVVATSSGTLSYQWLQNDVAIPGATADTYTTGALALADSGSTFSVRVTDSLNASATSNRAVLTVLASAPGTFTATAAMAVARTYHTATLLANGKVLLAGGWDGSAALASAELYDPSTRTFKATGSLKSARQNHTATLLADGRVLITGGTLGGGTSLTTLASAEVYDPAAGTFTATAGSMATGRSDHTATLLAGGKVLVAGGRNGATYLGTAELFDPAAGTFTATGTLGALRATHTATLLPSGKVLVAGGYNGAALAGAELYDPAAGTFTATGSLAAPRAEHVAVLLASGQVLLVGGASTATCEVFDPAAGTFSSTGGLVTARRHWHTASLLSNGKVLVAGGVGTASASPLADAELYDPAARSFTATGSMGSARELHTATALPNGKVLVAGGAAGFFFSSAELYF